MGEFKDKDVEKLLVACHRCCCVCHRFCGVKMEIDHIIPQADKGPSTYENAIPVCFECHAEIHSYNTNHPRGKKFQSGELRAHRDQWLSICKEHPEIFRRGSVARAEVGPLQSLIDELEFNEAVITAPPELGQLCLFKERQFLEAMRTGSIAVLQEELKRSIYEAYVYIGKSNFRMNSLVNQQEPSMVNEMLQQVHQSLSKVKQPIQNAKQELLKFLSSES